MVLGPPAGGNGQDTFNPGRELDVSGRILFPGDGKTKTPDALARRLSLMPQPDGEPGSTRKTQGRLRPENGLAFDPVLVTGSAVGPTGGGVAVQGPANAEGNRIDLGRGTAERHGRGGPRRRHGLSPDFESGQQEIPLGIPARTAVGQAGIGQGFQPDGRDPLDLGLSHDDVRFAARFRSRCQQGTILLAGQFRAPQGKVGDRVQEAPGDHFPGGLRLPSLLRRLQFRRGTFQRGFQIHDLPLDIGAVSGQIAGWRQGDAGAMRPDLRFRVVLLHRAVEEGEHPEVLLLGDGIVLVIVALGAGDRAPEPDGSGGLDPVQDSRHPVLLRVGPTLGVDHGVAVESGGDLLLGSGRREAGLLLPARW